MDKFPLAAYSILIYKLVSLGVGTMFAYLGYRLFMAGVWGNSGDLKTNFGDTKIVLKAAAPGTFFALFGTIIILAAIFMKMNLEYNNSSPLNPHEFRASQGLKETPERVLEGKPKALDLRPKEMEKP